QRTYRRADSKGPYRVARPDLKHALDVGARRCRRLIGLQSRKHLITELAACRRRAVEAHCEDHVGLRGDVEESETWRHDADYPRRRCERHTAVVARRLERELAIEHRLVAA